MSKGEADPLKLIVGAVILLIAMVVIIVIFRGTFSKEANVTTDKILGVSGDADGDGVSDLFDFCPYNSKYSKKEDTINGKADCACSNNAKVC